MSHQTILIAEDDPKTVALLQMYLEQEGYTVLVAHDGYTAVQIARQAQPNLLLLDLMLPTLDGLDVCRILRSSSEIPIIMVTARTAEVDRLLGLNLGADDYISKPFSPREVVARVRAVLRRISSSGDRLPMVASFGDLQIDFAGREARMGTQPVNLTPKEFKILEVLAREPGRAFSRNELLERVFGSNYEGVDRTVDVHVMNLRRKIEADPANPVFIKTVYGLGYKFANGDDHA
ncbi:MAG TPA: response regulator transcription factor [Roseiflexaceae bacterium]|nr:response regulator transcription factor [Roseiflexaceae bacterium]